MCVCVHVCMCACVHVCMCVCMCAYEYMCTCTCVRVRICVWVVACVWVCMCVYASARELSRVPISVHQCTLPFSKRDNSKRVSSSLGTSPFSPTPFPTLHNFLPSTSLSFNPAPTPSSKIPSPSAFNVNLPSSLPPSKSWRYRAWARLWQVRSVQIWNVWDLKLGVRTHLRFCKEVYL